MDKGINRVLTFVGIALIALFAYYLSAHRQGHGANVSESGGGSRFYYCPYSNSANHNSLDNPAYRRAYERSEGQWNQPYTPPKNTATFWDSATINMLISYGLTGLVLNLLCRSFHLFAYWRDGEDINWLSEVISTFVIPVLYVLAMIGIMFLIPIVNS